MRSLVKGLHNFFLLFYLIYSAFRVFYWRVWEYRASSPADMLSRSLDQVWFPPSWDNLFSGTCKVFLCNFATSSMFGIHCGGSDASSAILVRQSVGMRSRCPMFKQKSPLGNGIHGLIYYRLLLTAWWLSTPYSSKPFHSWIQLWVSNSKDSSDESSFVYERLFYLRRMSFPHFNFV